MLILHAGMHKTGTTAIQHALAGALDTNFTYAPWQNINHGGLFSLLFEDDPGQNINIAELGLSQEKLAEKGKKAKARLKRSAEQGTGEKFVFSAERIMFADRNAVRRLKAFFSGYFPAQSVYVYVRPPVGFLESMFQQNVKRGQPRFDLPWPRYRRSIEKLDLIFGRENVHLRLMRPSLLDKNDVVADFMAWAGLAGNIPATHRRNDRLGAQGLALTYMYQQVIAGLPRNPEQTARNSRLIQFLRSAEGPPFAIDRDLLRREVKKHAADMEWIETRLGSPVMAEADYTLPAGAAVFSTEADILEYAHARQSVLDAFDAITAGQVSLHERLRHIGEGA